MPKYCLWNVHVAFDEYFLNITYVDIIYLEIAQLRLVLMHVL